jgi:ABC-type Zn uptake system ZnuABC Zn-binding protein ZnuA
MIDLFEDNAVKHIFLVTNGSTLLSEFLRNIQRTLKGCLNWSRLGDRRNTMAFLQQSITTMPENRQRN